MKISEAASNKKELNNNKTDNQDNTATADENDTAIKEAEDKAKQNNETKTEDDSSAETTKENITDTQNITSNTEISETPAIETELQDAASDALESIDNANTVIDDETQQEIDGAQTQTVEETEAAEEINEAQTQTVEEEQAAEEVGETQTSATKDEDETQEIDVETIEETDKILASNVDNESEGINATPEDKTETEVEASTGAGDKSQQETKDQLTEEQTLANNLAENEELTVGESKRIAGDKFEITEDGKYLVNDKEVSADDFSKSIGEAKAKAEVKQEKLNKAIEIGNAVLEAGSQGMQIYSAIQSLTEATEQEDERNVLSLSDMQKGKSLIRKIKKRRAALFGYTRSA